MTDRTRIVFGNEITIDNKEDHRNQWIEELKILQKTLDPLPRTPNYLINI